MNNLIETLKQNGEDFEFYPTTKEMIKTIWNHNQMGDYAKSFGKILDIGCGTCNFKKWINELNNQEPNENNRVYIRNYYVIEKSKTLIDMLDANTIVLGTDFNETTLIDKKVDTIFCNPPYSAYEQWVVKILKEANADSIYLVIPQRWKENKNIVQTIKSHVPNGMEDVHVLGNFDFLNAERAARAQVDVLYINMEYRKVDAAFDAFFEETFGMKAEKKHKYEYEIAEEKKQNISNQLVAGVNKIDTLVALYNDELDRLFKNYTAIASLDDGVLEDIGVSVKKVKDALKEKLSGLKMIYWQIVFDNLDDITSRLTSDTRDKMINRFRELMNVDFTYDNIYALVVWVIKNAKSYYDDQLIDFFKNLSSPENVKPYKSNQKVFSQDKWRFADEHSHYTLDYRIVCGRYAFKEYWKNNIETYNVEKHIGDFCAIANNLGFRVGEKEIAQLFGEKYNIYLADGGVLFEYKIYMNNNIHIKMNKEFAKALNVEASRLLGWIREKSDITKEFSDDMAEGADKYFNAQALCALPLNSLKLLAA